MLIRLIPTNFKTNFQKSFKHCIYVYIYIDDLHSDSHHCVLLIYIYIYIYMYILCRISLCHGQYALELGGLLVQVIPGFAFRIQRCLVQGF
jgi:hypothetical protein